MGTESQKYIQGLTAPIDELPLEFLDGVTNIIIRGPKNVIDGDDNIHQLCNTLGVSEDSKEPEYEVILKLMALFQKRMEDSNGVNSDVNEMYAVFGAISKSFINDNKSVWSGMVRPTKFARMEYVLSQMGFIPLPRKLSEKSDYFQSAIKAIIMAKLLAPVLAKWLDGSNEEVIDKYAVALLQFCGFYQISIRSKEIFGYLTKYSKNSDKGFGKRIVEIINKRQEETAQLTARYRGATHSNR